MKSLKTLSAILLISQIAGAAIGKNVQTKGDEIIKDQMSDMVTLKGNASIQQGVHKLTADKIMVDSKNGYISAVGNCVYESKGVMKKSDQMIFKVASETWEAHTQQ